MNIACGISTKFWAGVKTWMVEFGHELAKHGSRVFYFSSDPAFTEEVQANGCVAHCLEFGPDYSPAAPETISREYDLPTHVLALQRYCQTCIHKDTAS